MQECYRITDLEIARRSQVDSGVFQPPAQSFNPRLIRFQRELVGDLGRLPAGDPEPEMAGELDHGSHRIRDKLFVALDEHPGLALQKRSLTRIWWIIPCRSSSSNVKPRLCISEKTTSRMSRYA